MPLLGEGHSCLVRDETPYFMSLAELDAWFAQPHDKLSGVIPYYARPQADGQSNSGGKLLVCHDYKSSPLDCAIPSISGDFVIPSFSAFYSIDEADDRVRSFSHNRVTIPPAGWSNAAHKQGTRILGTLIFEGRGNPDCLQLLVGCADFVVSNNTIPISRRYAVLLAELAYQRGFDGYLLNFESRLNHGTAHALALATWILLLKSELQAKVGPHARVVWYDSVIYNGWISYQNRLNGFNLPFFLAADTLFTNYWWRPETQASMTQYFTNLKRPSSDPHGSADVIPSVATKTLQDIYSGVDVFPREGGKYQYGCGLTCYRAISHTSPRGFSTALFAPGWTWEQETREAEANWNDWWENERKFWLGPADPGEIVPVPESPEGPFRPISTFFPDLPPPEPSKLVFYTHFSPGVGYSWFVAGKKVLNTRKGWTDIDKQTSIGNLVWPRPVPSWKDDERQDEALTASTALDMTDGYNGGNTLKLTIGCTEREPGDKVIWLPVQSLTVTTHESFEARVVYKIASADGDTKPLAHVKSLSKKDSEESGLLVIGEPIVTDAGRGWTSQIIHFTCTMSRDTAPVAIGFLIDIGSDPSVDVTFILSLGQLAVYPAPPPRSVSIGTASVAGAKFSPSSRAIYTGALDGVLTWDTASTLNPIVVDVKGEESTTPAWLLSDTPAYRFPIFTYFNVYVAPLNDTVNADPGADDAVFIGTTGLDGRANRFYVEPTCLPPGWDKWDGVRFYIQGITDRGEVLPWERCATTDHRRKC